jgi:hypothetical protein
MELLKKDREIYGNPSGLLCCAIAKLFRRRDLVETGRAPIGPTVPFFATLVEQEKEIIEGALAKSRGRIAGRRERPPSSAFLGRRSSQKLRAWE